MDISELLNGPIGKQIISGIGQQAGTSDKETASVVSAAAPILLGMLHKNASTQEGASSLNEALNKHNGNILDNVQGFLKTPDLDDGNGILGHVLGQNQDQVKSALSQNTGVSMSSVTKILALLAPFIMGFIGKSKSSAQAQSTGGGITDILGSLMGGNAGGGLGGNILGSILGGALGGGNNQSSGGLGSILGGLGSLFGKK